MADRTETSRGSEVLCLQRNDAGGLSSFNGEETPSGLGHGGEVYFRRPPGDRRRRRHAHGNGARTGRKKRDWGGCRFGVARAWAIAALDVGAPSRGAGGYTNGK